MHLQLGPLYHWSPIDRRAEIRKHGLVPGCKPAVSTAVVQYVCLGTTPLGAWAYSGDTHWMGEVEEWDLWQVRLVEGDEVHIRAEFAPHIVEVRVHNTLPADRVIWVGTRTPWLTASQTES